MIYTVYFDQRLTVEVVAHSEEEAKRIGKEYINDEISCENYKVKIDTPLEFVDIESEEDDTYNEEEYEERKL